MRALNIVKLIPYNFPLHSNQGVSTISAFMPYVINSRHNFTIISTYSERPYISKHSNLKIIFLAKEQSFKNDHESINNITNSFLESRADLHKYAKNSALIIKALHLENSIDLIETEQSPKVASYISKKVKNIPVVSVHHNGIKKKHSLAKRIINTIRYHKIFAFIFVANFFKKNFIENYPLFKNKCYVIHNSYAHMSLKNPVNINHKNNEIMFLGRGLRSKGIKEFATAITTFLNNNINYTGKVVASIETRIDQDFFDACFSGTYTQELIKNGRLNILINVQNTEVGMHLEKAKIVVLPTITKLHVEGIPMVALEAGLAKCLIISSTSGGLVEINSEESTYLHEVSEESILEKLNYFTKNEIPLKDIAEKQHNFIVNNFNLNKLLAEYDDLRENLALRFKKCYNS